MTASAAGLVVQRPDTHNNDPRCNVHTTHAKMVLRIPESGLQLASSAKSADTLPLQAFALTLSDTLIEDLIQCVENGEDIKLSLGNVPVSAFGCLLCLLWVRVW